MVAPGGLPDSARSSREVIRKGTGDRPAAGDRDPRARAADRGARVSEDDEALRPDGGHSDR